MAGKTISFFIPQDKMFFHLIRMEIGIRAGNRYNEEHKEPVPYMRLTDSMREKTRNGMCTKAHRGE